MTTTQFSPNGVLTVGSDVGDVVKDLTRTLKLTVKNAPRGSDVPTMERARRVLTRLGAWPCILLMLSLGACAGPLRDEYGNIYSRPTMATSDERAFSFTDGLAPLIEALVRFGVR